MKKMKLPNFKGKTVSFVFKGDTGRALEDPRFEIQGGRLFLVGTSPRGGSTKDWVTGLQAAVAWDCVQDYVVFDSTEDYERRLSKYYGKKRRDA